MKNKWIIAFVLLILFQIDSYGQSEVIILSDSIDAYFPLAVEISQKENLKIIQNIEDVQNHRPDYILWIISPANLTENRLVKCAQAQTENFNVPIGIISGKTIEDAKYLWDNKDYKPEGVFSIFNGTNKSNLVKAKILKLNNEYTDTLILNKANLKESLLNSAYIQISLHGAPRSWFDEHSKFSFEYNLLPDLQKSVIQSHTCNNFRPWIENSIALECINKGAIAFSGFIYSPISGTKIGEYDGLNFQYTWDDFTIGTVVQIQNNAANRTYAKFPHYFMLGDPRVSFNSKPPYSIIQDSVIGDKRIIKLSDAMIGFLPVKITNGSDYRFLKISNGISHSDNKIFFNNHIESLNLNDDKYILFENNNDIVTIEMKKYVPIIWKIKDTICGFIDSSIVSHQYGDINIIIGLIFFIVLFVKLLRRKIVKTSLLKGFILSLLFAFLIGAVYFFRWSNISTTSKLIELNYVSFGFDWFLLFAGVTIYFNSKSTRGKILALLIPFSPIYLFAIITYSLPLIRLIVLNGITKIEIMKTGYPANLGLIEGVIGTVLIYIILRIAERKMIDFQPITRK
jgi:hypothetical protein